LDVISPWERQYLLLNVWFSFFNQNFLNKYLILEL
jgi:hypothetical protein